MTVNVNPQAFDDDAYPDELRPGTELLHGQYVIEKFLNSGGFGITYLAKDSLDRTVVIKECFPGSFCRRSDTIVCVRSRAHQNEFASIVKLFIQEAKNLAKLKHPNIVGVHQIFEDNETAYMALDYIEGRDLLDILEDPNDGLTPTEVQHMTMKLLSAVEYIHKAGVLHRDISPDNILIDRRTGEPVLIDFGAAREEATRQTRLLSAMRVVKDGYSPQEFYIQGSQQSPSSDLYAFAATLYHVMTNECPPDSQSRLAAVAAQKPDPYRAFPPEVPGYETKFLKAINQAMNIFPYDRIQSAAEWMKYITPEPEIVALPSNRVQPRRASSIIADAKDLEDHAVAGESTSKVQPPVPAMISQPDLEEAPAATANEKLDAFRESATAEPEKKSNLGIMLGGVAAAALIGAVGAVFVLPEGTFTGGAAPETQSQAAAPTAEQTPAEVVVTQAPTTPAPTETPAVVAEPKAEEIELAAPVATPASEPVAAPADELVIELADVPVQTQEPTIPTALQEKAALPAITLPAPAAEDVVVSADAPALTLEDTARLISANDENATLADSVEQAVMAALSPPSAPQTQAPEMIDKVTVSAEAPTVFAIIEPSELTTERFMSILQQGEIIDLKPTIDVATADPMPEPAPEPAPAADQAELASVTSGWTVDVPFTGSFEQPSIITSTVSGAPAWAVPGTKIVAVNGTQVSAISEIPAVVRETSTINGPNPVVVQVMYQVDGNVTVEEQAMILPTARNIELLNGFAFKTVFSGGEWRTLVSESPESEASSSALRPGDRLVAYIPTNERLDRENALSEIFERELNNGTSQFAFAVNRDGELWVASLGYNGGTAE